MPVAPITIRASEELKPALLRRVRTLFEPREGIEDGTRGGEWAWAWGYLGRAMSIIYCATDDTELLEAFERAHETFRARRDDKLGLVDDVEGKVLKSWGSVLRSNASAGQQRVSDVTSNGLILLPFTDLLLRAKPEQLPDDLRSFLTETVIDTLDALSEGFRHDADSGGGYFIHPLDKMIEPLNHQNLFGAAAAEAWKITGNAAYRDLAENLYRYYRHHWHREDNGTVSWAYRPFPGNSNIRHEPMRYGAGLKSTLGAESFFKAAVTIELPVAMNRVGLLEDDELRLIAKSIGDNVMMPEDRINYYISPRKTHLCTDVVTGKPPILRPHYFFSFIFLSKFDPAFHRKYLSTVAHRTDLFRKTWLSGPPGMMAAAQILYGDPSLNIEP